MSTITEIVEQARDLLQDTVEPYRYSDLRIVRSINGGLRESFRLRPDLFLGVSYVLPIIVEADIAAETTFPLEDQFFMPIVEYIVGIIELSDDEFAVDNRAITLLSAFRQSLIGVVR